MRTIHSFLMISMAMLLLAGCRPEAAKELGTKATAGFTITAVPGKVNTFALHSTSKNAFGYQWLKGTGGFVKGNAEDTAYFPLAGTYTVQLRAYGRGGYDTASQNAVASVDDILNNPTFQLLTGKNWKLDPADGSIIVGTDGNPAAYFGGGAIADCQKDDVYTFSTSLKLTYNSNGSTFNGGNIAPNFACGADRSYTNVSYTFDPRPPAAGAGIASITLPGPVIPYFIGVTDVSSNNYRIISITPTTMVLRSGTATETVHQFKYIGF